MYVETSKNLPPTKIKPCEKFKKVQGKKSNTKKSVVFLHTSNEQSWKEIKKMISFILASKRIKYLDTCILLTYLQ